MATEILCAILIVLFPLSAYIVQAFFGKNLPRMGDWVSISAIAISFLLALRIFISMASSNDPNWAVSAHWTWVDLGTYNLPFKLELGILIDNISAIMLLMVTLCATLIHIFSSGYMRDYDGKPADGFRYASFFSYLSLFTSAMLGLVISDNLFTLFMFWELMGLCSYLLIGFYRHKISAANASIKAFMTTRVGDTLMFLGMMAMFGIIGSFRFTDLYAGIESGLFDTSVLGFPAAAFIAFLIFCGTVGKSAQFPLQVWLPDAMEGPTPVSALIHAATMVAAGVYLIIRTFPLLEYAHILHIVAYVGAFTALAAAILAIKQTDIKKVLAYSTLSQLGYMVLAIGVGTYTASFMHLVTHAVFKACLFMASGAVIYAMHHEQDMNKMGGLKKKLPRTYMAMFVATLAISGVPFFSGFVSKDMILAYTLGFWMENPSHLFLPIAAFTTAGLTAFYMFRLIFKTFYGEPADKHHYDHAHEVPNYMWIPLWVLAGLSLSVVFKGSLSGFGSFDQILGGANDWFVRLVKIPSFVDHPLVSHETEARAHYPAMFASLVLAGSGIFFSYLVFCKKSISAEKLASFWPKSFQKAIDNLYFFDFFYIKIFIQKLFMPVSRLMSRHDDSIIDRILVDGWAKVTHVFRKLSGTFDDVVIDGAMVDGFGGELSQSVGSSLRVLQNGRVQRYLLVAVSALILVMFFKGVL